MTIAVTGASGQLGRLVVQSLLAAATPAEQIVAIVRDPSTVTDFADQGVTVRQADYTDQAAYRAALAGIERLLLISTAGPGATDHRHANVVRAAVDAGVSHLAYTSILHADASSNPLAIEHAKTEQVILDAGIPATLLRNGFYHELYTAQVGSYLSAGEVVGATGDGRLSGATREDFAAAAAVLLAGGAATQILELGGPSYSLGDLAAAVSEVTGTPVAHRDLSVGDFVTDRVAAGMPEGTAQFLAAVDASIAAGEMETDSTALADLIGRQPTTLADAIRLSL